MRVDVHCAPVWYILDFLITVARQCHPGTHHRDGAAFQTQLQISHEKKTLLFLLLTCKNEALLGQLSHRNMVQCWSWVHLCWPAAVWIPPRLLSHCENLLLLWVCSCFSRMQLKSLSFNYSVDDLWQTNSVFIRLDFMALHHTALMCVTFFGIRDPSFYQFNHRFIMIIHPFIHPSIYPAVHTFHSCM